MEQTAGKIYQAIPAIMGEIHAVGKNQRNKTQGFNYRGVDDVMNAINPALIKNKVFIVPEIIEQTREERQTRGGSNLIYSICRMRFKFCAEDGSHIEAVTIGEGMDSGDKATNKAMAIAFKYACFQVFCIPTEEMKDPDAESHEVKGKPQTSDNGHASSGAQSGNGTPKDDRQKNQEMIDQANQTIIDEVKVKVLRQTIREKGLTESSVLEYYKAAEGFESLTFAQWNDAMKMLEKYPNKNPDKKEGQPCG